MLSLMVSTAALLSPPRVAITGSTGKLGTEAVKQLVAAGYQVRALVRPGSESKADAISSLPGVALVSGSVTSASDCVTLVDGCSAVLSMHGARRSGRARRVFRQGPSGAVTRGRSSASSTRHTTHAQ